MINRKLLKKTVEDFGYDEGLEKVLIHGVNTLSDSTIVSLVGNLDSYKATINDTLAELDCFIAQIQARPTVLNRATEPHRKALDLDNASPQIIVEKSCKAPPPDETRNASNESKEMLQPYKQFECLLDISSMYFVSMSAWIDIWAACFRINTISEGINPNVPTRELSGSDVAVSAVKSAIAAANAAFDSLNKAARDISAITHVVEPNIKRRVGDRTSPKTPKRR